jgi:hypothetical protein
MTMEKRRRIVVVGGSAAGPKAAAKARRIDNEAEVIILQKDADLSMASCGYPYYVGKSSCPPGCRSRGPM